MAILRQPMLLLAALLAAGALTACSRESAPATPPAAPVQPAPAPAPVCEIRPVPTAAAVRMTLTDSVRAAGRVVANRDVEVKCKASGQVVQLPLEVGDSVKAGEILAQIDPVDEQRKVRQTEIQLTVSKADLAASKELLAIAETNLEIAQRKAEANLRAAESNEANVREKANRMRALLNGKLCSQEEYENAAAAAVQAAASLENTRTGHDELKNQERSLNLKRQDVKQAEAAVARDEITLAIAQDRLRDTRVTAPLDGVVTKRDVQVGQIITSATSTIGGGTTIATLSDLSRIFVCASVGETDIGRLRPDLPVVVTTDAFPGRPFTGKLARIAPCGANIAGAVTFEARIEILDRNRGCLKPEMSATAEIIVEQKKHAVAVPQGALLQAAPGVFCVEVVTKKGAAVPREIQTGLHDGAFVEVLSGLKPGEIVRIHEDAPAAMPVTTMAAPAHADSATPLPAAASAPGPIPAPPRAAGRSADGLPDAPAATHAASG